jgi:hypothetical protein
MPPPASPEPPASRHMAPGVIAAIDRGRQPSFCGRRGRVVSRVRTCARQGGLRNPVYAEPGDPVDERPYQWILNGLDLYAAFDNAGWKAIECFPTASWRSGHNYGCSCTRSEWSVLLREPELSPIMVATTEEPHGCREAGANPALSRNCERGAAGHLATEASCLGKAASSNDPQARRPIRNGHVHSH